MPLDERGLYAPADFTGLRSQRFSAPRVATGMRVERGCLREPKRSRQGREYLGRNHHLLGQGFHDSREAEQLLLDAAEQEGLGHESIEIEALPWLETEINASAGPG